MLFQFTSHRTDIYEALFEAATGEGKGRPCVIRPTQKVIEVVRRSRRATSILEGNGRHNSQDCIDAAVTTADGTVYKADVVVGA